MGPHEGLRRPIHIVFLTDYVPFMGCATLITGNVCTLSCTTATSVRYVSVPGQRINSRYCNHQQYPVSKEQYASAVMMKDDGAHGEL